MQNDGTIYGYARVSTDAQDLAHQLGQLKAAGCAKTYREKISGATAERPELKKLLKALTPGDTVIIVAVDRLSRDTTDLLIIAREVQHTPHQPREARRRIENGETQRSIARSFNVSQATISRLGR